MISRFEFATAGRVIFGPGVSREIGSLAGELGSRALVVTWQGSPNIESLLADLKDHGVESAVFAVSGEPTTGLVRAGAQLAQQRSCDLLVGYGGGSALDTAKAIAALVANGGDPLDYLEVIGRGQRLTKPSLPWIAIPTTAGTGAEVTRNAVLGSPEHRVKVSLRSAHMLARLAIVDPELTYSLPPEVTASTGLDALTQVLEPYVSIRANPLTDPLCREGLYRAARSLRRAYDHGEDAEARTDMSLVSLLGGLALANAGLGAVHGFAGPVGGMFVAPHGAICARILPYAMATNVAALQQRQPDSPALHRYDEVARIMTGDPAAKAPDGVRWIQELCNALQVPPLAAYGIGSADIPALVEQAAVASSMKANPIKLTEEEMRNILVQAL